MPTRSSVQSTLLMSSLACGLKARLPESTEHVWPAGSTPTNSSCLEDPEEPTR